jgi:hypothetical protein
MGGGRADGGWDDTANGLPPADLTPEHAEAWREGYAQGRRQTESTVRIDQSGRQTSAPGSASTTAWAEHDDEPTAVVDLRGGEWPPPAAGAGAAHGAAVTSAEPRHDGEGRHGRGPLWIVGLTVLAVLLVAGAFGVGRLFADGPTVDEPAAGTDVGQPEADESYQGAVDAVDVAGSSATCQAADSVDAAGNPTSYKPAFAHDSDLSTAWRCDGRGIGERVTLTLPEKTTVAEVGLVPGYAKTDPISGVDRYAENNRITRVRWHFDDGSTVVQKMSGAANDRSMRTLRVPETDTGSVVIEVLASRPGTRNTVAISEVRVATPSGG